jgi:hypothetical protein
MRKMLAVLALGVAVVACSEPATAPRPGTPAMAPSFAIGNAPPQSGIVMRAGFPAPLIWGVPSAGLEVVMGVDAGEFCALWPDPSGATFSIMTFADKILFDRVLTIGQESDVPTQVWAYGGGDLDAFCAMVLSGAGPLATGVTRGVQFFSDLSGTGKGSDIFMWNYHGFLTLADGSQAVFAFQMHWSQFAPTQVTVSLH